MAENDVTVEREVWIMMEGGRAFDWRGGGSRASSADVAALCGPPRTDNESNLAAPLRGSAVSQTPEQSSAPLIFHHSFYLNANIVQRHLGRGLGGDTNGKC